MHCSSTMMIATVAENAHDDPSEFPHSSPLRPKPLPRSIRHSHNRPLFIIHPRTNPTIRILSHSLLAPCIRRQRRCQPPRWRSDPNHFCVPRHHNQVSCRGTPFGPVPWRATCTRRQLTLSPFRHHQSLEWFSSYTSPQVLISLRNLCDITLNETAVKDCILQKNVHGPTKFGGAILTLWGGGCFPYELWAFC